MAYYSSNSTAWTNASTYHIRYSNQDGTWISVNTTPTYTTGESRKNASLLGLLRQDYYSQKTERLKQALN